MFFFRADRDKQRTIRRYVLHKIFYALYPEYAIKPLGLIVATVDGRQLLGMTSEIVRNRSENYKLFHYLAYTDVRLASTLPHISFAVSHNNLVKKIQDESGIMISSHPVNVIDQLNKPIFVEVENISPHNYGKLSNALHQKGIDVHKLSKSILDNVPSNERERVKKIVDAIL